MNTHTPHTDLGLHHLYVPSKTGRDQTLLLLHGTGGDEHDLLSIAETLAPDANILSPRGNVLERGMTRFFRRLAEGVFDIADLIARTHELADFVAAASDRYAFNGQKVIAVGFSNGANIAAATLLLRPEALLGAALWRPMVPLVPETAPALAGKRILLTNGAADPMVPADQRDRLATLFRTYGATVESATFRAGHGLVAEDVDVTRSWLQKF